MCETAKNCSSEKDSPFDVGSQSSTKILDRWFAIIFLNSFLSQISISNSCSSKIHLINHGLASFFESRYLKAV